MENTNPVTASAPRMKTQVAIFVKNWNIVSRLCSLCWFVNIFRHMPMDIIIDGKAKRVNARKTAYVFDLTPGEHEIMFKDTALWQKEVFNKMTFGLLGAGMAGGVGGSFIGGAAIGANSVGKTEYDNGVVLSLNEGDLIKLSAKAKRSGMIKIKLLND